MKLFHRSEQGFQAVHAGRGIAADAASVFHDFLAPQVKNLATAFPGINCEISTDNRFLNLTKGEADIAIRPSNTPPDALFVRRVANLAYAVCSRRREKCSLQGK